MPRWLWITLGSLLLLLGWESLRFQDAEKSTVAANSASSNNCPLPDKFRRSEQPLQSNIGNRMHPIQLDGAMLKPLAGLSLQARVLAREDYRFGTEAEFSPTDLTLGWGPMSEPGLADKLNLKLSGRFYRYSWGNEGPPIPVDDIVRNSANMHMVPANDAVANVLETVSTNDIVELHGWLIRIEKNDGWRWQSSLTRDDSGDGSCELVYVCAIGIKN